MSTTYRECPECGKRALSVATRCTQCGAEFPARPLPRPGEGLDARRSGPRGRLIGLALLAAAAVAVGLVRGHRGATVAGPEQPAARGVTAPAPTTGAIDSIAAARAVGQPETGVPRVVINWANIRQSRARSSPAVGRLEPGDSVLVDSLQRGWYRVLMDGRPVGYVHRTSLGTALDGRR